MSDESWAEEFRIRHRAMFAALSDKPLPEPTRPVSRERKPKDEAKSDAPAR
ncbi:hypothetical protein [Sphingomonas sp.]|uniref:hypothetical protein n=1 Tax=Sphingomonas sp. TaxID=28214 RepID=UPI002FDB4FB5